MVDTLFRSLLSDFLPVLENLGLRVFAEDSTVVILAAVGTARIHAFQVQDQNGARLDVAATTGLVAPVLLALHAGRAENDRLNSLILRAQIDWRAVDLLRTYANHGLQIGAAPSRAAIIETLTNHPESVQLLWQYFEHKFDPLRPTAAADRLQRGLPEIERQFVASLDRVSSVSADRTLRALFAVVAATVRTNFYSVTATPPRLPADPERSPIAIKLECARIEHLPKPYPLYEVYVHAATLEGVHLRGAKVSRGGIRLSDRHDDFRTEILGLLQTQTVKNAVIVPAGAKGGFVVKRRAGAAPNAAQIVAAYRAFIGALLDVTDNIVHGRATAPPGMITYDPMDPYLVVAADKGTATLSDVANEVAAQRQFWLGDAFASGGTHGYDHKREGITARGAWESVKQHFHEMGRDAEREPITVVGIGDMSGDVFGNGLLLSRRFLLRAAFNHLHIFIDPEPDAARSYTERERLFHLERSTWTDYSSLALGPGGGIYLRSAKRVSLSPAALEMLGFGAVEPTGEEVVHAILQMDADLLWNGGIGTYVKGTDESNSEVGDTTNDAVRVNGKDLLVEVVAEGGNLGLTQRGRVEYALRGGRINTDAIDNSGGVDMSDHEVNLKIARAGAVEGGQVRAGERDQILRELVREVTQRVLAHNVRQARLLGLDQIRSQEHLIEFRDLMAQLEADGVLDRRLHQLPDREALRGRRAQFLGLTRPELAVLLAHAKLALQHQLLGSSLPDDPYFEPLLRGYFPDAFNLRFGHGVRSHRLRREIIAVELGNQLIDTMGMTFVARIHRDTGTAAVDIARVWAAVTEISGLLDVHSQVMAAEPALPLAAAVQCWSALASAAERAVKWFFETQPADTAADTLRATFSAPVSEIVALLPEVLTAPMRAEQQQSIDAFGRAGTPRALAEQVLVMERLVDAFEIAHIAADLNVERRLVGEVYYGVAEMVDLDWTRQALEALPADDRWEQRAIESLHEGLNAVRRQLTRDVLLCGTTIEQCLEEYATSNRAGIDRLAGLINDMKSARKPSLAAFLVVVRALGRLTKISA